MLLILSPSKTQQSINRNFPHSSQPVFHEKALSLANHLKSLSKAEIARLMKTSEKLTNSTHRRIHSFQPPFSLENTDQTIFTFQGDAYSQMTPESYSEKELFYAQAHLYILSGLYGVLRPLDLIFPYRLEMGTKLNITTKKNLYQYWSDSLTEFINSTLAKMEPKIVVNLASTEYFKALNQKNLQGEIVTIVFRQKKNSLSKTIPIYSKKARGLMTHFAITAQIQKAEDLKSFDLGGYSYLREESAKEIWVFEKEIDPGMR
jgi:cytoplasmic iron level regulating protein YaaA (DUF328/UPF0246 family)